MSNFIPSGLKIFDVIEILFSYQKSRKEVAKLLEERGLSTDSETVSKYIRTLKAAGFEVSSKYNAIEIINSPFKTEIKNGKMGLSVAFSGIGKFFSYNKLLPSKFSNIFTNFEIDNVDYFPDFNIKEKTGRFIIEILKYINDETYELDICYRGKKRTIVPYELQFRKNGIFVIGDSRKKKKLQILRVEYIEKISARKVSEAACFYETVFKINKEFSKNYILKKGEKAHYRKDGTYIINRYEPKEELFCRLAKYGGRCEIIEPQSDRKKMKQKLLALLEHYKSL